MDEFDFHGFYDNVDTLDDGFDHKENLLKNGFSPLKEDKMNDSFNRDRHYIDSFAQQELGKTASPREREDAANNAVHLYRSGLDTVNAARIGAELAREGRRIT